MGQGEGRRDGGRRDGGGEGGRRKYGEKDGRGGRKGKGGRGGREGGYMIMSSLILSLCYRTTSPDHGIDHS